MPVLAISGNYPFFLWRPMLTLSFSFPGFQFGDHQSANNHTTEFVRAVVSAIKSRSNGRVYLIGGGQSPVDHSTPSGEF